MKFIFADSLDLIDPHFDFAAERTGKHRFSNNDDCYPHELMDPAPYKGMLISLAIAGDHRYPGKYTFGQMMRLRREGSRKFLRLPVRRFKEMEIFGDCGAFAYVNEEQPRYTCTDTLDFYEDAQFTHGMSVDHIIFDFDREVSGPVPGSESARFRYELTLANANEFLKLSAGLGPKFTPIGVVQGWSPSSMAAAAGQLESMGYTYIALGGLVPLRVPDIHRCLYAVRAAIRPSTRIHLLGFAKEEIEEFDQYGIESFDSSSPVLRAFKDSRANYYTLSGQGLEYYTAIRIPQAIENKRLVRAAHTGELRDQEQLKRMEQAALTAVRGYDQNQVGLEEAVECVAEYGSLLAPDLDERAPSREKLWASIVESATRTLRDRPWSHCSCWICRTAGVEVMIYRGANRNKRRGFHNLGVYFEHVQRLSKVTQPGSSPARTPLQISPQLAQKGRGPMQTDLFGF